MNETERQLIDLLLDGALPEAESTSLLERLEHDPEAVTYLADRALLHNDLRRSLKRRELQQWATAAALSRGAAPERQWLSWRPLAAAAAGLVFGMFCTSVVFAYVRPTWELTMTLLKESFESGDAPLVTGVPTVLNRWSGDYSEVVEAQQGVKPMEKKKMLRLLRADYEGKARADASRIADLYRLIDMRPYREQFADGGAVVQFSAAFNAAAFPEGENYLCRMSLHAFDSQMAAGGRLQDDDMREDNELAEAKAGHIRLDRDPATWQRVGGDLRLPANTDFLMVHITVHHTRGASPQATFPGQFLDDVRLTMSRRPPSR